MARPSALSWALRVRAARGPPSGQLRRARCRRPGRSPASAGSASRPAALTAPVGNSPRMRAATCATVSIDWCSIAGRVRPPMCGVARTRGWRARSGLGIWSAARPTSSAAPASWPPSSAASSAASSTISPRDALTKKAPRRIAANSRAPIRSRVSAIDGARQTTKSAPASSSASGACATPSSAAIVSGALTSTRMSKARARRLRRLAIRP